MCLLTETRALSAQGEKRALVGNLTMPDAGLILVRELDKRLGLENLIADHLNDSLQGLNTQFRVT